MEKITKLIEQEIQTCVNERVAESERKMTVTLEHISKTYDISLQQLLRDVSLDTPETVTQCLGLTKAKKRCPHTGKHDGYCGKHKDQRPRVTVLKSSPSQAVISQHTHTLPPMFLAGCPVCDESCKKRTSASKVESFFNSQNI